MQHVAGNRMPPGPQQPSNLMPRNPSTMINVSQAPPIYPGGPSPGMPGTNPSSLIQQQGPSPGAAVTSFVQSPNVPNQNMMSPSPITQGPRSVGSPMINPNSNQSIATPQQSDATHDQRQDEQAYLDKVKQLGKYIEPLRRMIARIGKRMSIP